MSTTETEIFIERTIEFEGMGEDDWTGWHAHGHHDPQEFLRAIECEGYEVLTVEEEARVRHVWWYPAGDGGVYQADHKYMPGSFPVTILDRD